MEIKRKQKEGIQTSGGQNEFAALNVEQVFAAAAHLFFGQSLIESDEDKQVNNRETSRVELL